MLRVDAKEINPGDTYLSLPYEEDREKQIREAIDKGAACVITNQGEYEVKTILTPDTITYLSNYLKELYLEKIDGIKIIGIVGVTGNDLTHNIIAQTLNNLNSKTAYIEEDEFYLDGKIKKIKPSIYTIYECIGKAIDNNCDNIIIGISRETILQRHIEGLRFDIAIYQNMNQDSNIDDTLIEPFKMIKKDGYAIIDTKDKYYEKFVLPQNNNIFAPSEDYKITEVNLTYDYIEFSINNVKIRIQLLGSFNIYNFLNAYIIAKLLNYDDEEIIESAQKLKQVEGKYQTIKYRENLIIIDNANDEKEINKIIKYTKEFNKGKIITIIGCDSTTQKEERTKIGTTITNMSDYTIFTSDNPRYEQPEDIIEDMKKNAKSDNYDIIIDRKDAIKTGIDMLSDEDILLILGKGNEEYQIIGNDEFIYNDYKEVMKNIKR